VESPQTPPPAPENDVERLRRRLHRAIDRMSFPELCALPVRAEHFIYED
jgi:hypothetical protein